MSTRTDEALDRWLRVSNIRTFALTALMTLIVLTPHNSVAGYPVRMHDLSLAVAMLYAAMHGIMLLHIGRLSAKQDPVSLRTAEYLRHPCRISSLDLAAYWAVLAVAGPIILGQD